MCVVAARCTGDTNVGIIRIRLSRLCMRPPNKQLPHVIIINVLQIVIIQQRSHEHFNLLILLSCNFNNFVTLASRRLRLPEDDADALKHIGVLTIYKILLMYLLCICWSG